MEHTEKNFEEIMNTITENLNKIEDCHETDGNDDNRVFIDDTYSITVHAPTLGREDYQKMEEEISEFSIEKELYTVYVWNDISGWDYWNEGGKFGDFNYIMVCASINTEKINDKDNIQINYQELADDLSTAYSEFEQYDNIGEVNLEKYLKF